MRLRPLLALALGSTLAVSASITGAPPAPAAAPPPVLATSDNPDFGPNVTIFDEASTDVQAKLDAAFDAQLLNPAAQFGDQRETFLFKPGSYDAFANLGFYTALAGLGKNPDDVTINGNINVDSGWNAGDESNATQNFWRSAENLSVAPDGGTTRWAVSQAAPMRRVHIKGNMTMGPSNQDNGQGYASGGYLADSRVDGGIGSGSQQQWYTRNSAVGGWDGGVWNMVFSGVQGAPAADQVHTVLDTTPVTKEKPYLYLDGDAYRVFVPALDANSSGVSWPDTAGDSVPLSQFYVAHPGDSAATMNQALDQGLNLFFTPGVYELDETLEVTRPDTIVYGLGFPTLVPQGGVDAMRVADTSGVNVSGLLFDAGADNSEALLTVGEQGVHNDHAADPTLIADTYFRVGGPRAGKATNSLVVNSDDTVVDHTWIWRADHGAGVGWDQNTADTGIIVNGDDVLATGLFVEHYQKYEAVWNGERGRTIFFQNEMPYDPPSQAAWTSPTGAGYASYKVADDVTTHEMWGGGVYTFFNVDPSIRASRGFEVPAAPGVQLHNAFTVSLGDVGGIEHVVNDTGGPVPNPDGNTVPQYVPEFPVGTGGSGGAGVSGGSGGSTGPVDQGVGSPDRLPLRIANDSGIDAEQWVYIVGTDLASDRLGFVDGEGTFRAWPAGSNPPSPAPEEAALAGSNTSGSKDFLLPKNFSGRIYFSFGDKIDFRLTPDGLVQPAPWAKSDPNYNTLLDWSEFTYDDGGLFLNSSQVDMFAVPHTVSVTGADGAQQSTGTLVENGHANVIKALRDDPDWAGSVVSEGGRVLRVLAPGKAAEAGVFDPAYLDDYISGVWEAYRSKELTVVPFGDRPDTRFSGRTIGDRLVFTDVSGAEVASFAKPTTANVWGCDGALLAPNDQVVGPIARTLCAGLVRGTLGTIDTQPSDDPSAFYRNDAVDLYAKVIHDNMVDGKAYAFPFDDVGNFESLVHDGNPTEAAITVDPLTGISAQ